MLSKPHRFWILCAGQHLKPASYLLKRGSLELCDTNSWLSCLVSCSISPYMHASIFCALAICKIGRVSSSVDYVKTQCGKKILIKQVSKMAQGVSKSSGLSLIPGFTHGEPTPTSCLLKVSVHHAWTELQAVVGLHVGAGNRTQVPCKGSKHS